MYRPKTKEGKLNVRMKQMATKNFQEEKRSQSQENQRSQEWWKRAIRRDKKQYFKSCKDIRNEKRQKKWGKSSMWSQLQTDMLKVVNGQIIIDTTMINMGKI